jgi:50S ribosomal protein L16 3-hydroxylase
MAMRQIRFPEAVDAESFLHLIWQRKPLLMRGALPDYRCPLSADELAGLACEEEIESRVVIDDDARPWQLVQGPLAPEFFDDLPTTRWTLLVQDVDKHVPAVAELLDYFTFLPDWRIDDVMISYAADGGSVGPHVDQYDVFLVQAEGRRRWSIDTRVPPDAPLRDDTELKILAGFAPEHEWVLEPGDVLYLPPGVAHWGIAEGPCMTCSVGFRAPSWREMLIDFCEYLIEREPGDAHYRDPTLSVQVSSAEISAGVLDAVEALLGELTHTDAAQRRAWFGRLVTEPKPHLAPPPRGTPTPPARFHERLRASGTIRRHPWSRTAFAEMPDGRPVLFANGVEYPVPASCQGLLRTLAHAREMHFGYLEPWLEQPECLALLAWLYDAGVLEFPEDRDA